MWGQKEVRISAEAKMKETVMEDKHSQKRNLQRNTRIHMHIHKNNKEDGTSQDGTTWTTTNHAICKDNGTHTIMERTTSQKRNLRRNGRY